MPEPSLVEVTERSGSPLDVSAELAENLEALIEAGQQAMVLNLIADLYPADIERILSHLPLEEAKRLFEWLPADVAGEVLAELDSTFRARLLREVDPSRITELVDELDTDDAADVLADLPEEVAREVLPDLEDADEIKQLLVYDEETAGGLMDREYVAALPSWTVEQVTEEVRRHAEDVDIYGVFIVDEAHRLLGIVPLKRILLSPPGTRMSEVMETDLITVPVEADQEEVARIMERYDLVSLPVVDAEGRLMGRITIDDVVDVLREEAEEDIQRMSGVTGDEEPTDSVARIVRGRLPWILAGMVGSGVAAFVIGTFTGALSAVPVLASFIPIVMATAGNAGIQSSAIAVQGLASGDVWVSDIARRLVKELLVGLLNGFLAALVLGLCIVLVGTFAPEKIADAPRLALTAGVALMIVIVLATIIGAAIPLLLERLGVDPAIATGPFITGSNDILGTLIFFWLATHFYLS